MNEQLKDILDLPILQKMLDSLWCASGIPLGIIGVNGDEVLVETGWQELCRQYHCKHPEIGQRCLLSWLASRESGGGEFADRKPFEFVCDSGLINIGQPIYYEDHYLGILFVGQLLYASPDVEFFRQNALRCGFDPAAYLKLLAEVPVIQREKAQEYLAYHAIQMQLLIEAGMRKLQEEKVRRNLEESEQTFRSLFENANDGIVIAALDGTILEMNPSICRQLGFSHDELVGCNLSSLTDASIQAQIPERIAQILSERSALFESMLQHKSGRPVPIEINARLINYHGQPALLGNIRDLSERKQAEKELQQSENRFRTIFETAAVGMVTTHQDGSIAQVNPQFCAFLGYDEEELLKLGIIDITDPEDRVASQRLIEEAVAGRRTIIDIEKRYLRKDGSKVWGRLTAAYLPVESSFSSVAMIQDISQSKAVEKALLESEKSFRSVVNTTPLGIHMYKLEDDGRLIFSGYNPAADEILGVDNSHYLGLEIGEAFPHLNDTEIPERYRQICMTGKAWHTRKFTYKDKCFSGTYEVHVFQTTPQRIACMFMEVSERLRAAEAVRTSEATLRSILTAVPMGIGMVRNRVFSWVSHWMTEELGYAEEELIGQNAVMLYENEVEFERVGRDKYHEVACGRMGEVQTRWVCKDGKVIDVLLRSMAVDPADLDAGVIFTALNNSEIMRSNEELHDKEEQLRLLLHSSGEAVFGLDRDGNCTFVNPRCLNLLGYSNESEILGKNTHLLFHYRYQEGTPRSERECEISKTFKVGEPAHVADDVFWRRDGTHFPVEYSSYPIVKDEKIIGAVVTFNDISERQLAENELRQALLDARNSKEQVAAILKSTADALIVVDLESRIIMVNHTAEKLLGQYCIPGDSVDIDQVLADQPLLQRLRSALNGRVHSQPYDLLFVEARGGPEKILETRIVPMLGAGEMINGAVLTLRDVTREREIDHLKDEFISTAAHELRTPMTSIQGYSELMMEDWEHFSTEQLKDFVAIIHERSQALSRIIGDMLDLSRVQSGRLIVIDSSPGDLGAVLVQALLPYRRKGGKHQFYSQVPDGLPPVFFDADKIVQVLDNLIGNAVKFSPEGGPITLSARPLDDRIEVVLADQGIGMTPAVQERIFERFFRADASSTGVNGLGLGMSLVKEIVAAHGGETRVESEPGIGTSVVFTLPLGISL
jgi:PAS domain S-box-containing protein